MNNYCPISGLPAIHPLCETPSHVAPRPARPAGPYTDRSRGGFRGPVTRERCVIVERPWDNPEGRLTSETTVLVGVAGSGIMESDGLGKRTPPRDVGGIVCP
jgi:hypothetical protein